MPGRPPGATAGSERGDPQLFGGDRGGETVSDIRVLLADDHAVVREGLKALINAQPGMEVVGEAADGPVAVELTAELDPDVVVVDVSMPGLNGAQVTTRLRQASPDRK